MSADAQDCQEGNTRSGSRKKNKILTPVKSGFDACMQWRNNGSDDGDDEEDDEEDSYRFHEDHEAAWKEFAIAELLKASEFRLRNLLVVSLYSHSSRCPHEWVEVVADNPTLGLYTSLVSPCSHQCFSSYSDFDSIHLGRLPN